MALAREVTAFFDKHVKRHGYLNDAMKAHLHRGYAGRQITEKELTELGNRIKQHIADRKGQPDYDDAVNALNRLQRDGLSLEPHAALNLLLKRIPKTQTPLARVVTKAIARVKHVTPTTTRPWHAIEKTGHGIAIVRAGRGEVKRFRPIKFAYLDYMRRMLNKVKMEGYKYRMEHDQIARFFPNRFELFHEELAPHIISGYRYSEGTKKVPELVIEPLINVPEEERTKAVEQLRQTRSIKSGELVGHRLHVFQRHNQPEAEKLARKMSRFFRHDVEIVRHY